jgi:hypothetical protein
MNVEIDIEAGEITASTDGIVEVEPIEYAESVSSVTFDEDFMDVDVAVRDIDDFREDSIEAILPKSPTRARASQLIILKAHEEVALEIKQEVPPQSTPPETPTKKSKKKKIPEALTIPKEISSLNGEPSTLVSTANLTQGLDASDTNRAEAKGVSPEPVSAIVAKKIDSVPTSAASEKGADFQFKEVKGLPPEPTIVEPDKSTATTVELPPKKIEEAPMSEAAKRRAEMEARRAQKQKELEAIKLGKCFKLMPNKNNKF